ncbi:MULTISPECIES: TIGR02328 family protein [Vagococcus]|uniref:TIGR02328 family protein n=1 Tax=Vagococcus TaxID=2737 RepID=UPI002FCC5064
MRLWHESLIKNLPRQQLLGQHRECCALRGNGWGKPHSTVNYVFDYTPVELFQYHQQVMNEMKNRGYKPNSVWENPLYRGLKCDSFVALPEIKEIKMPIYPEHNDEYLTECLDNLLTKNIDLRSLYK